MNKFLFLIFTVILTISAISGYGSNGIVPEYNTENRNDSVATINADSPITGTLNGHNWVDLGLPSGTKWATCNIGATKSEDYGDYYAWGETQSKKKYNEKNYKYTDNSIVLSSKDDVATANWGSDWRMPTQAEMDELSSNCIHKWTTQNGVNGLLFTGTNGNSIFLPAAGSRSDSSLDKAVFSGCYWSSSLVPDDDSSWFLLFASDDYDVGHTNRYYGFSIRPVCN